MAQAIVQVENLNLSYRNVRAVWGVSFTVEPGEIVAIIGENGSGKTSTVECVEGLRRPEGGLVRVFGLDPWQRRREVYRSMGVQLQETAYPSKIRVEEQCELFAGFYDRPADWRLLLSQLGLEEKKKRPISKLSGGERQRLSILLALMGRPRLLVIDELTTGLDPQVRQSMWASFESIRESGVAVVMVSHYLDEVEALADKILYLERGRQLFFGTQQGFREYARGRIPEEEWREGSTLEKMYLQITPRAGGLTLEGIAPES